MKAAEKLGLVILGAAIAAMTFNLWGTIQDTIELIFLPEHEEDGDAPAPTPISKAHEAKEAKAAE